MILWRLVRRMEARNPLDGDGSKAEGGRWNPEGVRVVYTATSLALAALEEFVELDAAAGLPRNLVAVRIEVPPDLDIEQVRVSQLPESWRRDPPPRSLAAIGKAWVETARTVLLEVPSAVVPAEPNVLVNPLHPYVRRLRVLDRMPFTWDRRLQRIAARD